jgi:YVTN family beta-propeller protein
MSVLTSNHISRLCFAALIILGLILSGISTTGSRADSRGTIYVANAGDSSVTVLDGTNHVAIDRIRIGAGAQSIAFNPLGHQVWTANRESGNLSVIETKTQTVIATVPFEGRPEALLFDPVLPLLYVTDSINNHLGIVDVATSTVLRRISVGTHPVGLAISPHHDVLATTNHLDGTVSLIERQSLRPIRQIPVGIKPVNLIFSEDGNSLFVTVQGGVAVIDVDDKQPTKVLADCKRPHDLDLVSHLQHLYVSCHLSNRLAIFDASTGNLIKWLTVGHNPTGITVSEDNQWVFVTNSSDHTVSVVNTKTQELKTIALVGQHPMGVVAANQSTEPIRFNYSSPPVPELNRTGIAALSSAKSQFGTKLGLAAVLLATPAGLGIATLRQRRNSRSHHISDFR